MVIALGLATATKWSGVYYAVAFVALMLVWDYQRRIEQCYKDRPFANWLKSDLLPTLAMPLILISVYFATWIGWFRSTDGWNRNWAATNAGQSRLPDALVSLLHYHRDMLSFHTHLVTPHSYSANPWGWPLMIRPTSFFYETQATCGTNSCSQEVIPLGNPLIWWGGVIALGFILWLAIRKQMSAALPIVVAFAAGWMPWLFFTHRTVFTFYAVVFIPYTAMALAISLNYLNSRLTSTRPLHMRWPALTFMITALVLTAFFYPILTGMSISYDAWHLRMWLPSWI
jgi:dolichyl-phosphate-mannose--protein O-mannosyl transferase